MQTITESSICDFSKFMQDVLYKLESYNYSLPKELIAQYPCDKRDESRLLSYDKDKNEISHHVFYELIDFLNKDDVLVLNNTKVLQARFFVQIENKKTEILLIKPESPDNLTWKVFAKPSKNLKAGVCVIVRSESDEAISLRKQIATSTPSESPRNDVKVEIIDAETVKFKSHDDLKKILNEIGEMPLPPYIKRDEEPLSLDVERYQTVFAKEPGAVAAPTASLHFTPELLKKIEEKGVEIVYLTLHVGPGTFLPVRTDDVRDHVLISEKFQIEKNVWEKILSAKKNGRRIVACGTTVTRTLEYLGSCHSQLDRESSLVIPSQAKPDKGISQAVIDQERLLHPSRVRNDKALDSHLHGNDNVISGMNDLYITPGFNFKIVDTMITNFHLPKSSLLLLVSAFIGWENLRNIYETAIKEKYRFFSYGDAMIIS